ncbi:MAG TPA: hypothetical protein VF474_07450 [Phenylobacterium sp.]
MTRAARIFAVENKLGQIAREPGGRRPEDSIKAADGRIEAARGASIAVLVEKAEQLGVLVANRQGNEASSLDGLYDISNAAYGLAGTFGLSALAEAAFSLCDLADHFRSGEPANWPAIEVHVDGIRLLANLGDKAAELGAESILGGLRRVRARVLPPA